MPRHGDLSAWSAPPSLQGGASGPSFAEEARRRGIDENGRAAEPRRAGGLGVAITVAAASALGAALAFAAIDAPLVLAPSTSPTASASAAAPTPSAPAADAPPFHATVGVGQTQARAARMVIVSGDEVRPIWRGATAVRAPRAAAPAWTEAVRRAIASAPLPVDVALSTPPQTIAVSLAPLWSPYLAQSPSTETAEDATVASIGSDAPIETGAIETGGIGAAEIVAPLTASAPPPAALTPTRRVETALARVAAVPFAPEPATVDASADPIALGLIETGAIADQPSVDAPSDPSTEPVGAARPTVSIVLTAFGLNNGASTRVLRDLPTEVAVAVAPVGDAPEHWSARAKRNGRTTLVEAPMEPSAYPRVNPGPLTLLTSLEARDNLRRFDEILAKAPAVDGVATYLGDRFLRDAEALRPILEAAARRDLALLENGGGPDSVLARLGDDYGLSVRRRTVSLDREGRTRDIELGLRQLEAAARRNGYAIGVGVTMPSTIDGLAVWARRLDERGIALAPLRL